MRIQFKSLLLAATILVVLCKSSQATPIAYVKDAAGVDGVFQSGLGSYGLGTVDGTKVNAGTFSLRISFTDPNGMYVSLFCGRTTTNDELESADCNLVPTLGPFSARRPQRQQTKLVCRRLRPTRAFHLRTNGSRLGRPRLVAHEKLMGQNR